MLKRSCRSLHTRLARGVLDHERIGFGTLYLTSVCFLIDHTRLNQKILFDCGARKDFENCAPAPKPRLNAIVKGLKIEADVNDVLVEVSIDLLRLMRPHEDLDGWKHTAIRRNFPEAG
jgi:hypothetical protein